MGKKRKLKIIISDNKVKIKSKKVSLYDLMEVSDALIKAVELEEERFNKANADAMAQQYVDELNASLKR